jgi:hypothetical protein
MNKNLVHIVVEAKSSFCVKDKITGNWFNPRKDLAKDILPKLIIGAEYDVDMEETKGKDKKTYSNVVSVVPVTGAPAIVAPVFAKTPMAKPIQAASAPATASVAINKDERILVQGLTQALLQSPIMSMVEAKNLVSFVETNVVGLVEMVRRLAK